MEMIPPRLTHVASPAERRIFQQLSTVEADGWTYALHSLNMPEHERKRVCEADFVLIGERGLLVLEVKGGAVRRDKGVWYSRDLRGKQHRLHESPLEQAAGAMFALEKKLGKLIGGTLTRRAVFGHAAVFPDVRFEAASVEWDPVMLIDRRRLEHDGWVVALDELGGFWERKPGGRRRVGPADVQILLDKLRPDFDLVPTLNHLSRTVEEELVGLTERQYRALDTYSRNPRLVLEGGAGTGKTMLAAEISRRAAAIEKNVLLTCRSAVLAGFIRSQPGLEAVTVLPFSQAVDLPSEAVDLLVVDEGQDLVNDDDLQQFDRLLTGGLADGRWVFLLDSNNQRGLVGRYQDGAMAQLRATRPAEFHLIDNCRNTMQIVTATQERTGADLGVSAAGVGMDVVSVQGDEVLVVDAVAEALDQIEREDVPMEQVVLLSPKQLSESVFGKLPARWRRRVDVLDLARFGRPTPGRVGFAQVADFKGLESPFILLESSAAMNPSTVKALLYVGMTRARAALWLLSVEDGMADRV
jgi:hypothetical protein